MNNIRIEARAKNNILKSAREEKGFNQQEMAVYCGVRMDTYGKAERLQDIPYAEAKKIADTLEMDLKILFPDWLQLFNEAFNSDGYLVLDNSLVQNRLEAFGGSQLLLAESFTTDINTELQKLDPQAQKVLTLYYGLNSSKTHTRSQIAELMNLSKDRIGQILEKGLRTLRCRSSNQLRDYVEELHDTEGLYEHTI